MLESLFTVLILAQTPTPTATPQLYYEREVVKKDLEGRSLRELTLMRNWIFARQGNEFRKQWLHDFFTDEDWYKPGNYDASKLSDVDKKNAETIGRYELDLPRAPLKKRLDELRARHRNADIDVSNHKIGALSPDGKWLLTGHMDRVVMWDAATGERLHTFTSRNLWFGDEPHDVAHVRFLDGSKTVAAATYEAKVVAWSVETKKEIWHVSIGASDSNLEPEAWGAEALPGGRVLVWGYGGVSIWNPKTKKRVRRLTKRDKEVWAVSADGRRALIHDVDRGGAAVWDLKRGKIVKNLDVAWKDNVPVALNKDGTLAVIAGKDSGLIVLTLATGVRRELKSADKYDDVVLSADDKMALVSGPDFAAVWDLSSGTQRWRKEMKDLDGAGAAVDAERALFVNDEHIAVLSAKDGAATGEWGGFEFWPDDETRIEATLLARALGEPDFALALEDRSPLDDPRMLDALVSVKQLKDLSRRDLRLLRNTVFARHGRIFKSPSLADYFDTMEWYEPDKKYADKRLTKVDHKNIKIILSVENELGGPLTEAEHQASEWMLGA